MTDVPRPPWTSRVGRSIVTSIGYLFIVLAVVMVVPAVVILILLSIAMFTGGDVPPGVLVASAGLSMLALLLFRLGLRVARGRRHLVLFLRKFGFDDASEALTVAVSGAMGRRWRLVTLDDAEIEAVGVHRGARLSWGLARLVAFMLFVLVVVASAAWWLGGGVEDVVDGIFDAAIESGEASGQNAFETIIGAIIVALAGGLVVLSLLLLLAVSGISALGVASVGFWQGHRSVERAERAKTFALSDPVDVEPLIERIRRHATQIQAPRLVVLKVHDRIWRCVVHELAEEASVVVVDVSDPTEHLLWEVGLLRGDVKARLLPVGRRDRVEALLAGDSNGVSGAGDVAARLRSALGGAGILVYEADAGRGAARRFAQNLSVALDAAY